MTQRLINYGRIAALLLFGSGFALGLGAEPAAAGGCGYGCYAPAPVVVQPYYSSCGCGGYGGYAGYGGYGGYGYTAPYAAYAAEYDEEYAAPRYYRPYRRHWRHGCC